MNLVTEGTLMELVMVCPGCMRFISPPSGEASAPPVSMC
jgi:hypothetical protein